MIKIWSDAHLQEMREMQAKIFSLDPKIKTPELSDAYAYQETKRILDKLRERPEPAPSAWQQSFTDFNKEWNALLQLVASSKRQGIPVPDVHCPDEDMPLRQRLSQIRALAAATGKFIDRWSTSTPESRNIDRMVRRIEVLEAQITRLDTVVARLSAGPADAA